MSIDRKLAAIMFTDIVGFTKTMADSEDVAIDILGQQDNIFTPQLEANDGNLLKKMGDGLLIEFPSAVKAVECAINIQSDIKKYNESADNEFHIRIGIHLGDVLTLGDDVLGDGVNIASRIEPLAAPDGICITEAVQQSIKSKVKVDARRVTEVDLKHIDDKYTLYKIPKEGAEDYEAQQSSVNNTISINTINNTTDTRREYLHTFKYLLLMGAIPVLYIFPIIGNMIIGDSTFIDFINHQLSKEGVFELIGVLVALSIVAAFSYKKTCKISFKDIRNVHLLLDVLILDMGYKLMGQEQSRIKYIHKPKIEFMFNFLKESKFYPKVLREMDVLTVNFNGNTVTISGMQIHVNKAIKKIKKRDKSK